MFMCLKRTWHAIDARGPHAIILIPAGWYEVERVKNPYSPKGHWLVVKGTMCGAAEGSWRQWANTAKVNWLNFEVLITECLPADAVLADITQIIPYTEDD